VYANTNLPKLAGLTVTLLGPEGGQEEEPAISPATYARPPPNGTECMVALHITVLGYIEDLDSHLLLRVLT